MLSSTPGNKQALKKYKDMTDEQQVFVCTNVIITVNVCPIHVKNYFTTTDNLVLKQSRQILFTQMS